MSPSQALIAGLAAFGLILLVATTRRIRSSRRKGGRRRLGADAEGTAKNLEQVMIELDQLARQIHARLDDKLARLEAVIRKADDRIDKLSRTVRAAEGAPTLDVTVADLPPGAQVTPGLTPNGCPAPLGPDDASSRTDDTRDRIYRFADTGLSAIDIAHRVGRTTGEIELILSLRKTRKDVLQSASMAPPAP